MSNRLSITRNSRPGASFEFDVTVHSVEKLSVASDAEILVSWSRGPKVCETHKTRIKKSGSATWNEPLSLMCSLSKDPKTGGFESKLAKFAVKEVIAASSKKSQATRTLGEVVVDLAEFTSLDGVMSKSFKLRQQPQALLHLTLRSRLVSASQLASRNSLSNMDSLSDFSDFSSISDITLDGNLLEEDINHNQLFEEVGEMDSIDNDIDSALESESPLMLTPAKKTAAQAAASSFEESHVPIDVPARATVGAMSSLPISITPPSSAANSVRRRSLLGGGGKSRTHPELESSLTESELTPPVEQPAQSAENIDLPVVAKTLIQVSAPTRAKSADFPSAMLPPQIFPPVAENPTAENRSSIDSTDAVLVHQNSRFVLHRTSTEELLAGLERRTRTRSSFEMDESAFNTQLKDLVDQLAQYKVEREVLTRRVSELESTRFNELEIKRVALDRRRSMQTEGGAVGAVGDTPSPVTPQTASRIHKLQVELDSKNSRIMDLEMDVSNTKSQMQMLQLQNSAQSTQIETLQDRLAQFIDDLELKGETSLAVDHLQSEILALNSKNEESNRRICDLENELATRDERIKSLQTELTEKSKPTILLSAPDSDRKLTPADFGDDLIKELAHYKAECINAKLMSSNLEKENIKLKNYVQKVQDDRLRIAKFVTELEVRLVKSEEAAKNAQLQRDALAKEVEDLRAKTAGFVDRMQEFETFFASTDDMVTDVIGSPTGWNRRISFPLTSS
eukprot:GILJ01005082.1.p1 GENE.GILJ01005082.1~~GILJ01005082.1.p1  ORF type:complete len:737 (-),score=153.65 GILJ01005082.1:171-2381(-)